MAFTWSTQLEVPVGYSSNYPGSLDLSGVYEVTFFFSGKAYSRFYNAPAPVGNCVTKLFVLLPNCTSTAPEFRQDCLNQSQLISQSRKTLCALDSAYCNAFYPSL